MKNSLDKVLISLTTILVILVIATLSFSAPGDKKKYVPESKFSAYSSKIANSAVPTNNPVFTGTVTAPEFITTSADGQHYIQPYNSVAFAGTPSNGMLQTTPTGLQIYLDGSWGAVTGGGSFTSLTGQPTDNTNLSAKFLTYWLQSEQTTYANTQTAKFNNMSASQQAKIDGLYSELASVKSAMLTAGFPQTPTRVTPSAQNYSSTTNSFILNFTSPVGTSLEYVFNGGASTPMTTAVNTSPLTAPTPNTPYSYTVTATKTATGFTASYTGSLTYLVAPLTPVISVTPGDTTNQIALTSGGTGTPTPSYDLKWGTTTGIRSNTISGVTLPYTHINITNSVPYYYSVVATNTGGSSESTEVSGIPNGIVVRAYDNFTETNGTLLSAHTSDSGHTWTLQGGSTLAIDSNTVYATQSGNPGFYYSSYVPTSADYSVQAGIIVANTVHVSPAVAGRISTSAETGYFVRYANGVWELYRDVTGTRTPIGTYTGSSPLTRTVCKLEMIGSSIKVYLDGVERISVTDTGITAAGRAGVSSYYADAVAGRNLDNWEMWQ